MEMRLCCEGFPIGFENFSKQHSLDVSSSQLGPEAS